MSFRRPPRRGRSGRPVDPVRYSLRGEYDYLLKIQAPDMKYYNEFIINVLGTIDSIGSILSSFVMAEIKNTHGLYI